MRVRKYILAFNRGIVSALGRARYDVERVQMSAERMVNWMPRILGSMTLRPGLQFLQSLTSSTRQLGAVYSATEQAGLLFSDEVLQVADPDDLVTRGTVTAAITNGLFTSNVTSWTDSDEGSAVSQWVTGYMDLQGTGTSAAIREQAVTVNEPNEAHALRIVIQRGPVLFRVGSASGLEDYIAETSLGTGEHSLAFTPTGNFYVRFYSRRKYSVQVDSIAVESAGTVSLTSPYPDDDLRYLRSAQSADVTYLACRGYQQRKVERRLNSSWSLVKYEPEDGPFRVINSTQTSIAPSAISGNITLTASTGIFRSTHVGALIKADSYGQTVTQVISSADVWTDPIRISGVGATRSFLTNITGLTATGSTVTTQNAYDPAGPWQDASTRTTDLTNGAYADGLDNQIIYWRIGIDVGDYVAGTITVSLSYAYGSISGIARITAYTSTTVVSAVALKDFGNTGATKDWYEGAWSDYRGWPTACSLYEGRTWWAGNDKIIGSVSDAYESFDASVIGDSGYISRTIGFGPIQYIHWILPLGRLLLGTALNSADIQAAEINGNNVISGRSTSFDEPLTPTNFNMKTVSPRAVFVDRSGEKLSELSYSGETAQFDDYNSKDLSMLAPDLNEAGIKMIAAQHKPDLRIHCVLDDGTVSILVFDPGEEVTCWVTFTTDGLVEDVMVLPGEQEDQVYYIVNRSGTRRREKWAMERDCRGATVNKQADSFVHYSGAATTTITGLSHLNGKKVVVWADGADVSTYATTSVRGAGFAHTGPTVSGGSITLSVAASEVVVGLPYDAVYVSGPVTDLESGAQPSELRTVKQIGLTLAYAHKFGLRYGPSNTFTSALPEKYKGRTLDADEVLTSRYEEYTPFDGTWGADEQLCLKAAAPRPVTVLTAVAHVETSEK